MKNFIKKISLLAIAFVVIAGAFATPGASISVAQASLLDDMSAGFGNTQSSLLGDFTTTSYEQTTSCDLGASATTIANGGSVTLSWDTKGFTDFTLNGQAVSGESGNQTFTNVTVNTTYTFVATNSNGDRCQTTVDVQCLPPVVVDKKCELDLHKTVNKSTANVGDEITYTIDIKNTGTADCTGGGVKILDVVDANVAYKSHTLTSNLTAGYGNQPVYTSSDRTLRFNGNDLTPGETGTITWTGKVANPTQCGDFVVKNQAKATAKELNNFNTWAYSETVKTDINNDCVIPVCEPGDQHYNPEGHLTGSIYAEGKGRVTNSSEYCDYKVGLASYQRFDNIIDNQKLFDSATGIVGAKSSLELAVSVPSCNYQIDLFYGHVLTSLDGQRYGTRLLDAGYRNTDKPYCGVLIKPQCPYTPNDGTVVQFGSERIFSSRGEASSRTSAQTVNLPAGEYEVRLASWDGYEGRQNVSQPNEKYKVVLANGGNIITQSNDTVDLADNVKTALFKGQVNNKLTVSSNVTSIYALHSVYPDNSSPNSLHPICAVFVPKEVVPAPSCDLFTATPNTIVVGGKSVLKWESTNATQAFLNNTIGAVDVDGTFEVSPTSDTVYRLTLIGAEDKTVDCEVPVTVSEDSVPVCKSFTASPSSLPVGGGNVTLAWNVTQTNNVSISPTIGSVSPVGSKVINVTQGTTYVLTAEDNDGDKDICEIPVTVADSAPVFTCEQNVNFSVSDSSIRRGDAVTLNWSTTGVDTVSISNINANSLSGNRSVSPSSDITYTLTATQGNKTVNCPVSVNVSTGGGGGGSSTPRCDLDISDDKIKAGEEITLRWDTSRATEVTIEDDRGNVIFTTAEYLSKDKEDLYDGSIKVKPTRDTQYTLTAERGSRDRECEVEVEVEDNVVVLQTRDQQPLVAGISLTQVPYTGFEAGPFMTSLFYALLVAWSLFITYLLVIRNRVAPAAMKTYVPSSDVVSSTDSMKQAESRRPDAFAPSVMSKIVASQTTPTNLPTGIPVAGQDVMKFKTDATQANQATDTEVTAIENRAHSQKALLSSDAVRYFIASTDSSVEREEALDQITTEAKKTYPLEDGWIVINQTRMQSLCEACSFSATKESTTPATVPAGTGSLAEAIVTGNVVAAYQMIGHRPMFALADAAADLDAVYRNRQGGSNAVSEMLSKETQNLSDEQITQMIAALTGALDGTYTDEASAVKMAIMKAVKVAA